MPKVRLLNTIGVCTNDQPTRYFPPGVVIDLDDDAAQAAVHASAAEWIDPQEQAEQDVPKARKTRRPRKPRDPGDTTVILDPEAYNAFVDAMESESEQGPDSGQEPYLDLDPGPEPEPEPKPKRRGRKPR